MRGMHTKDCTHLTLIKCLPQWSVVALVPRLFLHFATKSLVNLISWNTSLFHCLFLHDSATEFVTIFSPLANVSSLPGRSPPHGTAGPTSLYLSHQRRRKGPGGLVSSPNGDRVSGLAVELQVPVVVSVWGISAGTESLQFVTTSVPLSPVPGSTLL